MACHECRSCRVTYATKTGGVCRDCGRPLTVRPEGSEPYGRPLEEGDLRVTTEDEVELVKQ